MALAPTEYHSRRVHNLWDEPASEKDDVGSYFSGKQNHGDEDLLILPYSRGASRYKMGVEKLGAIDFYIQNVFGREQMHVQAIL